MGKLIEGVWRDEGYDTSNTDGRFVRWDSSFRQQVSTDGTSGFKAEAGRYHLYLSWACPWAHRTLIMRSLKKLEDVVSVSFVEAFMGKQGWTFAEGGDPLYGLDTLYQVYLKAKPDYSGRVTVPVLWDRQSETIVNNESSEIIRMLNSEFSAFGDNTTDYYPPNLRADIDAINEDVYSRVNNGVYRTGFATTQEAYEEAFDALFDCLDALEERLSGQRYLVGDRITEADWRLFTTLVRFDAVYVGHFKCNLRRIVDYANLWGYLRELYQHPGVAETVNMDQIKGHYYASHTMVNPSGIVPKGPDIDFTSPHRRDTIT
ncbi:MAG: glutathione S-transferase family protein [Rhodospirillaceae bacterium]|jgi:glutathionyl-hydroquinone reductase|nr:glutathione S-transferase family protein [Rhodospirillaceae bacterium]MBT5243510.1 glutathione S-transferase family protein [Rhodospirillaceae bacterium]MBT5562098.1 glutathione S-transferase family protein [Rhodospirillaceae bacterium]MBT6242271.1 glutathione S-transferase family protein [Rhodospirillaceae bacterium]MBT7136905.1 glutathione S-transferase family protein [Rhodospirillaceae bacterium]